MLNLPATELILGSASPRRAQLLTLLGVQFEQCSVAYDETMQAHLSLEQQLDALINAKFTQLLAHCKSQSDQALIPMLVADTLVAIDGQWLGKPGDAQQAMHFLQQLSGRSHQVVTSVMLGTQVKQSSCFVWTDVSMRCLSSELIQAYIDTGEPFDKAGGYGLQSLGGALVKSINGSPSAVAGLPLAQTAELLDEWGIGFALATASLSSHR